ncbi:MAG TPA: hypothetical protein VM658_02955 [bacterium]|nr:hypothetical protein [bacterium]
MKEFWDKHKADIGLAVLILYTLCLSVATADQLFNLGLFPTKLDRMVAESIRKFASDSTRDEGMREITQYGDFAVPQLVKALNDGDKIRTASMTALQKITDQNMDDPAKWKEWYRQHKDEFK